MKNQNQPSRRDFIKNATLAGAGLTILPTLAQSAVPGKPIPASDKIRMGFIGVGNRGSQLLELFMQNADCEIAALCDVYEPYTTRDRSQVDPRFLQRLAGQIPKMGEKFPKAPKIYQDYRKLLEDKEIDGESQIT